jgi:hypothetical protein
MAGFDFFLGGGLLLHVMLFRKGGGQLESVRKDVECFFGILKRRFRILKMPIQFHKQEEVIFWKYHGLLEYTSHHPPLLQPAHLTTHPSHHTPLLPPALLTTHPSHHPPLSPPTPPSHAPPTTRPSHHPPFSPPTPPITRPSHHPPLPSPAPPITRPSHPPPPPCDLVRGPKDRRGWCLAL